MTQTSIEQLLATSKTLSHMNIADVSATAKKASSGKSGGGGKFDEHKVKRDKGGKFATQAYNKLVDSEWDSSTNLEIFVLSDMIGNNGKAIYGLMNDIKEKYGVADLPGPEADKKLAQVVSKDESMALSQKIVDVINSNPGKASVSPSGTQRAEAYVDPKTTNINVRVVPNKKPELKHSMDDLLSWRNFAKFQVDFGPGGKYELAGLYLAHHGVKGQKWGVRRTDSQLSTSGSSSKSGSSSDGSSSGGDSDMSALDKMRSRVGLKTSGEKELEAAQAAKDVHVSADAERFVKTTQKAGYEMSDQEIKTALQRAKMVKEYDALFNPDPNSALKAKVEAMELQSKYAQYQRQLHPTKIQRVTNFVKSTESAYKSFQSLDKAVGGGMSAKISGSLQQWMSATSAAAGASSTGSSSTSRASKPPTFGKSKKSKVTPSPTMPGRIQVTKTGPFRFGK